MQRYLRVYRTFFLSSIARELEFRANFFAKVAQNLVWVGFAILILLVIYANTDSLAGWSRGDAMILMGTTFLLQAVLGAFFMALMEIPEQVRRGTLDYILVRPLDSQYWVSMRKFHFEQIGVLLASGVILSIGVRQAEISPSALQWLTFAVLGFCAVTIFYAFSLLLMTLGIWFVRVENLWVLGDTVLQIARYPIDIYGAPLQRAFTYMVPLAFLATIPSRQLTQGADLALTGLGLLWTAVFFFAARAFWLFSVRNYSSASS
ncbi:MAG: ABC-2 family transporter protein [Fimbriimonadaceae bacterium]